MNLTHIIDRADNRPDAVLAHRIKALVANGYTVEVAEAGAVHYRVKGITGPGLGGTVYWLQDPGGRHCGTVADVGTLVRYAAALPRPLAGKAGQRVWV